MKFRKFKRRVRGMVRREGIDLPNDFDVRIDGLKEPDQVMLLDAVEESTKRNLLLADLIGIKSLRQLYKKLFNKMGRRRRKAPVHA